MEKPRLYSERPQLETDCSDLNIVSLRELLKSKSVSSVEEFLKAVPACLSQRYVAMFHSESIQCATASAPRIIMFGGSTKIICSYNSGKDSDYKGMNNGACATQTLECLDFHQHGTNELYEISFPNKTFQISSPNPEKCIGCHMTHEGNNPKGLFAGYFLWPGAYGGDNDLVFHAGVTSQERTNLDAWLQSKSGNDRYKDLQSPIEDQRYFGGAPLSFFTKVIYEKNYARIAKILAGEAFVRDVKWYLLAGLRCSTDGMRVSASPEVGTGQELETIRQKYFSTHSGSKEHYGKFSQLVWNANYGYMRDLLDAMKTLHGSIGTRAENDLVPDMAKPLTEGNLYDEGWTFFFFVLNENHFDINELVPTLYPFYFMNEGAENRFRILTYELGQLILSDAEQNSVNSCHDLLQKLN